MGYADIHFHILPGVDDGPTAMSEAVELARATVRDGTADVVATPHVRLLGDPSEVEGWVADMQERLDRDGVPLRLHAGGELHPDDLGSLSDADLDALAVGPPGARWLLLEAPLVGSAGTLLPAATQLQESGYGVVIAHPERSPGLYEHGAEDVLRRIVSGGGAVQLNAGSLTGFFGRDARENALGLVRQGLADALASDAHRLARGPTLTPARQELQRELGERVARALVDRGPRELLVAGVPVAAPA